MSQFSFENKNLLIGNQTWSDIVGGKSSFPLFTMLETMKGIVQRNGAVMIAMPNEQEIKDRMDRLDEVQRVAQNANATRETLGLEPVNLQEIGL